MHIAVNTRLLLPEKLDGIGWFTHEVLSRLTKDMSDVRFTFLFDRPFDERFIYGDNVEGLQLFPPARHPLLYYTYFEHFVPRTLKRLRADLFFSPDGFLSLKTDIPQIPVIHDLNFEHRPGDLPLTYRTYYRHYFPRFARKAKEIITVSEYSRQDIAKSYGIDPKQIHVAHNGYNTAYRGLTQEEIAGSRKRFAGGARYFIFVGNFSYRKNLHTIIKAFDVFKSKGGEAKLLLVGNPMWKYNEMEMALKESPYREDIIMPGRLEIDDLVMAMGGAEALLFPSYFEGFGIPILEAFAAKIPVITSSTTSLPEVAGEAALFSEPEDAQRIGQHMHEIYSSELQRDRLISLGTDQLNAFSWNNTANKVKSVLFDN